MEAASPTRLYACAGGALLLVLGIAGFFFSASFGSPGEVEEAFGALRVNGWLNCLYAALGVLGLFAAGSASRRFSLLAGALFTGLAIWGFAAAGDSEILGLLPSGGANEALQLALGLLGFAALAGTRSASAALKPAR